MSKSKVVSVSVAVCCLCMCSGVFAQENAKSDVLASWHFDEGEGEIAKDSSGNENDLNLVNATWAEGKKGKCLSFNGKNSYAYASASDPLVSLGDEFTVSVWIKPQDYAHPENMEIVSCCDSERGPGYRLLISYGVLFFISGEGRGEGKDYWKIMTPRFKKGKIPEVVKKGYYPGELDNRWYHLAVTYKDGIYRIYVEGRLAAEKKERSIITHRKGKSFYIGVYRGRHYPFRGLIDELEILRRAKTGEEIIDDALMGLI